MLRERCDRHGILLVFDEVQSGIGRTGRPFAAETFGVAPRRRAVRQGRRRRACRSAASSPPRTVMAALAARHARLDVRRQPRGCAAALATLDVLDDEGCYERARTLGAHALRPAVASFAPSRSGASAS